MTNVIGARIAALTPNSATNRATSTTAVSSVGTATTGPAASPAGGMAPVQIQLTAPKMTVDGVASAVAGGRSLPGYRPAAGTVAGVGSNSSFGNGRGYIEATCAPKVGGWEIETTVHHNTSADDISLFVSARITDAGNSKESWIVLGMPVAELMNGADGKDADGMLLTKKSFFLSLDDLNAWLEKKGGKKADGTAKLVFKPGDPISIDAKWQVAGHECGGRRDQRYGYLDTPPLPQTTSVVGVQQPSVTIDKVKSRAAAKPVDLTLKLPQEIIDKYPKVFAKDALFVSRREEELKLAPKSFDELKDFTTRLIGLSQMPDAQQKTELQRIFGEAGWKVHLTDRYYKKDANGAYDYWKKGEKVWKVKDGKGERDFDFEGLPKVAGMYDQYQDVVKGTTEPTPRYSTEWYAWSSAQSFAVANANGAVRFRDGEIKSGEVKPTMGKFNLKPGGGVVDPYSLVATRLEYALDTNPGIAKDAAAMAEMSKFLDEGLQPYNPMAEFKTVNSSVSGLAVKTNVLDNQADRFKFTLEHESGLEVEISCDFIDMTSKNAAIEPPSTKGMTQDQKYDAWQKKFASFSTQPGASNRETFVEYTHNGKYRVEVTVEASIDAAGKKTVTETLNVKSLQVEIEMDHVQARTTGPVQSGGASAASKQVSEPTDATSEDAFFAALSDTCTFAGPPTIHNVSDLQDHELYEDPSYLQMRGAGIALQDWAFPNGVDRTRQKAALGLEMMGQIELQKLPVLTVETQKSMKGVAIHATGSDSTLHIRGAQLKAGGVMTLKIEGFPVKIAFTGQETAAQVKDKLVSELAKFKLYKPRVEILKEDFWDTSVSPAARKQRSVYDISLEAK